MIYTYAGHIGAGSIRLVPLADMEAEGAQGVARLCSAIFLGIAVDKLPRNLVLRLGAIYGVVVHAWLLVLVGFSDAVLPTSLHAHRIYLWYGTLPCFAIFDALANVVGAVVFADSVKTGSRVGPYRYSSMRSFWARLRVCGSTRRLLALLLHHITGVHRQRSQGAQLPAVELEVGKLTITW